MFDWSAELKIGGEKVSGHSNVAFNRGAYDWGAFGCIFWAHLTDYYYDY